jgi:hypothetical protein
MVSGNILRCEALLRGMAEGYRAQYENAVDEVTEAIIAKELYEVDGYLYQFVVRRGVAALMEMESA